MKAGGWRGDHEAAVSGRQEARRSGSGAGRSQKAERGGWSLSSHKRYTRAPMQTQSPSHKRALAQLYCTNPHEALLQPLQG